MKWTIGIIVIVLAIGAYFFLSPLFNTQVVDDPIPLGLEEVPTSISMDHLSEAQMEDMMAQLEAANESDPVMVDEVIPIDGGGDASVPPAPTQEAPTESETRPADGVAPGPAVRGPFAIKDTPIHPASGEVKVVHTADETIVRFEDFKTINGPRVHVYLAKDLNATEFIDLGPIRGTEGNINYTVPSDVDIDEYPIVMHWCVPFGVLFNYADIRE